MQSASARLARVRLRPYGLVAFAARTLPRVGYETMQRFVWMLGIALGIALFMAHAQADAPAATKLSQRELSEVMQRPDTLIDALGWRDAAGEHVAAFWQRIDARGGNARLQVDLWSGKPAKPKKLIRSIKDGVQRCEFDLVAEYVAAATGLTDLDADGIAELTFAYRTTCTSDVSPLTLKLLVLEQGAKYIVRGSTRVDVGGGELTGGEHQPDGALKKQPAFAAHAEAVWAKVVGPE